MKAKTGDRLIVTGATLSVPTRDGEILAVRGADGGPPYLVRWSDSGRETLFFPGPDCQVGGEEPHHRPAAKPDSPEQVRHVRDWRVDVHLYEGDNTTAAQAILHTQASMALTSHGEARRNPGAPNVPEIGAEVAAARALRHLADELLKTAGADLTAVEGHPVHLRA